MQLLVLSVGLPRQISVLGIEEQPLVTHTAVAKVRRKLLGSFHVVFQVEILKAIIRPGSWHTSY